MLLGLVGLGSLESNSRETVLKELCKASEISGTSRHLVSLIFPCLFHKVTRNVEMEGVLRGCLLNQHGGPWGTSYYWPVLEGKTTISSMVHTVWKENAGCVLLQEEGFHQGLLLGELANPHYLDTPLTGWGRQGKGEERGKWSGNRKEPLQRRGKDHATEEISWQLRRWSKRLSELSWKKSHVSFHLILNYLLRHRTICTCLLA